MCSPWYGNFCASDWNDLPARREFDGKFLENVKTSPHAKEKNTDHLLAAVSTEGKSIHLVFQAELRWYGCTYDSVQTMHFNILRIIFSKSPRIKLAQKMPFS